MYTPTTDDIRLLLQKTKQYKVCIDFLNKTWHTIGKMEGITTDLDLNIDGDSDIRRTATMTLIITDTDIVKPDSMVWIDKYAVVKLYVYDMLKKEYHEYKIGRFIIGNYDYNFSADQATLKLSLLDLMAQMTEERGNQITTQLSIPVGITVYPCPTCGADMTHTQTTSSEVVNEYGELKPVITQVDTYTCPKCNLVTNERPESTASYADITFAMKETVKRFSKMPFNAFSLDILKKDYSDVPYDLEYEKGVYPIQVISDLRDLYPNYQTYYDYNGVFVFSEIPTQEEDYIALDHDVLDEIIISEDLNTDFKDVCNVHDVWGQSLETDFTALSTVSTIESETTVYTVEMESMDILESEKTYCFTADADNVGQTYIAFRSNDKYLTEYSIPVKKLIGTDERSIESGEILGGVPYVVKVTMYRDSNNDIKHKCILYGALQIRGIVKTVSRQPSEREMSNDKTFFACDEIYYQIEPDNPFAADIIGDYIKACVGGEYDNIYTTQLALERGRYENYKSTRLNHKATLNTLIVPWLDVNTKIRYTSPVTKERKQYLVKSININLKDGTMTLGLSEFYPYYPYNPN